MLAKLVSGLHKPDDQTVLFPDQAWAFVAPLPVRALPGVGYKTEKLLTEQLGAASAADVRRFSRQQLGDALGDKTGALLWHLCRGQDPTPVRPTGPPRSITVEDSFKSCASWSAAAAVLRVLAPDLLQRLHDEYEENRRRPETLTLKWRQRGSGWSRSSASCAMPLPPGALAAPPSQAQVDQLVRSALQLLQKQLREPFNLSLINIGATTFKQDGPGGGGGGGSAGGGGLGTILDLFNRRNGRAAAAAAAKVAAPRSPQGHGAGGAAATAPVSVYGTDDLDQQPGVGSGDEEGLSVGGSPCGWASGDSDGGLRRGAGPGGGVSSGREAQGGAQRPLLGAGGVGRGLETAAAAMSPEEARRAAEQSAAMRRDYRASSEQVPAILSKSRERQLREAAAARVSLPGSPRGAAGSSAAAAGLRPSAAPPPPPPWQTQQHLQRQTQHTSQPPKHSNQPPQQRPPPTFAQAAVDDTDCDVTRIEGRPSPPPAKRPRLDSPPRVAAAGAVAAGPSTRECHERGTPLPAAHVFSELEPNMDWSSALNLLDAAVVNCRVVDLYDEYGSDDDGGGGENPQTSAGGYCCYSGVCSSSDGGGISSLPGGWWDEFSEADSRGCQQPDGEAIAGMGAADGGMPGEGAGGCGGAPAGLAAAAAASGGPVPSLRGSGPGPPRPQPSSSPRVFLHVDLDCFYCQVERLDDPSLLGKPLAVTQFNSGGFVAVSYEARAAGIRCGDGVGAGGRASIPYLRAMGAVSMAEAQVRCPDLVVRPMRTERYRRVAEQVHALLRRFAPDGQVEKTSYDDFYLDVTAACCGEAELVRAGTAGEGAQADASPGPPDRRPATAGATAAGAGAGAVVGPAVPSAGRRQQQQQQQERMGLGLVPDAEEDSEPGLYGEDPEEYYPDGGFADSDLGLGLHPDRDWEVDPTDPKGADVCATRAATTWTALREGAELRQGQPPRQQLGQLLQPGQPLDREGAGSPGQQQQQQEEEEEEEEEVAPPRVHVAGGGRWREVEPWLRQGVEVAQRLRAALKESLSMTASVGVAPTKLSARLAGPSNKPDAITVVPAARLRGFMAAVRIKSVPTLARKTGDQVVSELGVELVGQLTAWTRTELLAKFGPQIGNLLADLPCGGAGGAGAGGGSGGGGACGASVRERGPQKSILVERSFPAISRFGGVKEALVPMVGALWERVVEDAVANRRHPSKLLLTWRQGYGAPKTRSADVTVQLTQITRLAVAVSYGASDGADAAAGQRSISAFTIQQQHQHQGQRQQQQRDAAAAAAAPLQGGLRRCSDPTADAGASVLTPPLASAPFPADGGSAVVGPSAAGAMHGGQPALHGQPTAAGQGRASVPLTAVAAPAAAPAATQLPVVPAQGGREFGVGRARGRDHEDDAGGDWDFSFVN
ncbi:hypothetical protein PLESTM_000579000 [Pleodorina starrii]|nr:hypothetical protein PLESTM_000579000 [Pleodorina starrii]